jgi:trans-aconitate methyltransferase
MTSDNWETGNAYETFMGRWSRRVAGLFLEWLDPVHRVHWLEVGCGTGALTQTICQRAQPASLVACDPSPELLAVARNSIPDCPVTFLIGGADDLPEREGGFDAIVSGLVLNFVKEPLVAARSMMERTRRGGVTAAYVWDYAEGMQFLRIFWDEAAALDPSAAELHEGHRFPLCRSEALTQLFTGAGFSAVEVRSFVIQTIFHDFDAFWSPFLGGTGPAPSYVASLDPDTRRQLMHRLKERLVPSKEGTIQLTAQALGVRGVNGR